MSLIINPRPNGAFKHIIPKNTIKVTKKQMKGFKEDSGIQYLQNQKADLQTGDVVHFEIFGNYRNDGVAIISSKKDKLQLLNLEYNPDIDDYGYLPCIFQVIE